MAACELCDGDGGEIIFRHADYRVVRVLGDEGDLYPGFCRVIWNRHAKEMSDLSKTERQVFMDAVFCAETSLLKTLKPDKINLASLGNMTPHVHWHVIPRFKDDAAFPKPIWAVTGAPESKKRTSDLNPAWAVELRRALNGHNAQIAAAQ